MQPDGIDRSSFVGHWLLRIATALVGVAAGVGLIPSLSLAFTALFLFDAPGAASTIQPYLLAAAMMTGPGLLACSAGFAIAGVIQPAGKRLGYAIALLTIPAVLDAWMLDPLHLRRYPPGQTCILATKGSQQGKWLCHPLP